VVLPIFSADLDAAQLAAMNRRLERFSDAMGNPTPANREASIALYGWTIRNFDRQGGLQGGWAPLSPRTVREKSRIGKQVPLVRSGHLRAGFVPFHSRDNAGVGNEVEYSKYHHFGTSRLPRRELLPRRGVVLEIGLRVYGQYVEREARRANG
jgi:phage gpG-like protein